MGHYRLKALILKKIREVWPSELLKEMKITHYKEEGDNIHLVIDGMTHIPYQLLKAFAQVFRTEEVWASIELRHHYSKDEYGVRRMYPRYMSTIDIRNGNFTNIHRSKRIIPRQGHRFDLDLGGPDDDEELH